MDDLRRMTDDALLDDFVASVSEPKQIPPGRRERATTAPAAGSRLDLTR